MSAGSSQVAVLGTRGRVTVAHAPASSWSLTRLTTFGALALYGTLKWSTLLTGHPLSRLIGLFLLAMALAAGRPALARFSRPLAAVATFVALIAVFPIAGIPLAWVWHVRIAVTANAIGDGLSALPGVLVPYSGANQAVDLVMTLGAAVLLFDGALLVAFSRGQMTTLRRAGAALPLIALAAVPTTLDRPALPYLDGAILFTLLVAFMWGEEIGRRRTGGALGIGAIAVVVALFLAPALDLHKPWFNYRALAGGLTPTYVDGFDWSQGYGRIDWPRKNRLVLEVKATQPEYWKAKNLDWFNGIGWTDSTTPLPTPSPDSSAQARWTQKITVFIRDMSTTEVIGAGTTSYPSDLPESLNDGSSPGTWTTAVPLGPNVAYEVNVYAPHPSVTQLNAAGTDYASLSSGYRTLELPPTRGTPSPDENYFPDEVPNGQKPADGFQPELVFPPFHSGGAIVSSGGPSGTSAMALLKASDVVGSDSLASAYLLARRLAAGASTPYQFVQAVENYLGHGFVYDENPPGSPYPLVSFLFASRHGYCQQFAGAMALLLRMGGVPAHVSVGFTSGRRDTATGAWLVTDYDAHAWVEAWFPRYGWVRFDPTPGADPARSNDTPIAGGSGTNTAATGLGLSASKTIRGAAGAKRRGVNAKTGGAVHGHGGGSSEVPWIIGAVALVALALLGLATRPLHSAEGLVAELDGALRRIGRPVPPGGTLTSLERRLSGSDAACAYVRTLRHARFRGSDRLPTAAQRRALRRQLRRGLGPLGFVRSLWALPPRWGRPGGGGGGAPGRVQTHAPRGSGA